MSVPSTFSAMPADHDEHHAQIQAFMDASGGGTTTPATSTDTAAVLAARSAADTLKGVYDEVSLTVTSNTLWSLTQKINAHQTWKVELIRPPAGSYVGPHQPPWFLDRATLDVTTPAPPNTIGTVTMVDESDPSVVHTGAMYQWQNVTADARAYGGGFRYTTTAGEHVAWTTPAGVVHVVASVVANINGGYGLVEIDGSKTAATSLPTAQDEVTAGRLASTALVANGGTLNPTDRVLNFYSAGSLWDDRRVLATGLTAGSHTVRITCTGYKQGAASAARIFSSGFGSAPYATVGSPTTTTHVVMPGRTGTPQAMSAYEYAVNFAGASGNEYVGTVHGYDELLTVQAWVDGQQVDTATPATTTGSEVLIVRTSALTSPHMTGKVADVTCRYRLTRDGLEVSTRIVLAQDATIRAGYLAMLPTAEPMSVGHIVGTGRDLSLTAGTGGAAKGFRAKGYAAYTRNPTTGLTALMHLPDLTGVNEWAASGNIDGLVFIEDRAGNSINKIYATRWSVANQGTYPSGTAFVGRTIYRAQLLPSLPPELSV